MTTVALTADLEEYVNAKVQSGQFNSFGEVVRAGIQLLQEQDMLRQIKLEQLRKDLMVAVEQADRGEVAPLDVEAILVEGRKRLAERRGQSWPK